MNLVRIVLFVLFAAFSVSPWGSPPLSLLLGIVLALTLGNPFTAQSKKFSKLLLQAAVVGLGFGLDLNSVLRAGSEGFLFTLVTIISTLILGTLLGKLFQIDRKASTLISVGTAICGGSAIAAVGPVIKASDEEMSVSLGTIFILNSIALFLFPVIGHNAGMSQEAFGLWSALAIHDTSSVVGATSVYGPIAAAIGTTVKLSRALWIIPISFFFAYLERRIASKQHTGVTEAHAKIQIPWFIGLFILASLLRSLFSSWAPLFNDIQTVAKIALSLTLFLIGAGLSRSVLKKVGVRPLATGVLLWFVVGISTFLAVWTLK